METNSSGSRKKIRNQSEGAYPKPDKDFSHPPLSPVKNYPHPGVPVITCENSASHSALAWLEELADSEESGGCWDLGSNISLLLSLQQGSNVVFLQIRAVDPHSLYTDPDTDPDPAVFLNADPDPDPGPGLA